MPVDDAVNTRLTPGFQWSKLIGYPITLLLEIALTAVLLALDPYIHLFRFPIYYVLLVLAAEYLYGEGPAIFAFVLGLFAIDYYFTEPKYILWPLTITPGNSAVVISYIIGSAAAGVGAVFIRRSKRRIENLAENLRMSEERFRGLVETTSDWIWEVDAQGVYTYASPKIKDLLGYEPHEIIGKTPFDLMLPEEAQQLTDVIQHHFERAEPFGSLANLNLHKNGHTVLLETSGLPVFDENGVLTGYRGIDRDITERKRAEEALKESEYRYAAAQRAAKIGSWDWYIQTGELVWSERIEPMFGFAPGEFEGTYEAFLNCIHPDDRQFVIDSVDAAVYEHKDYKIEHRIVWPDGAIHWVSENGEVHWDQNGIPVRMFGIVQDITERKLAEEKLYEVSQRLMFHIENTPLAVIELDTKFRINRWTKEAEKIFGWSADEAIGKRIDDFPLIYKEDKKSIMAMMGKMRNRSLPRAIIRNRNYRKDGSIIYCEWYNSALQDSSGKLISILSLALDVTQEVSLRQKLEYQIKLLQQALIPSTPMTIEGYTAAAIYLPGSAGLNIGGDFYDSFQTESGKIGFVIGDVSGKGIETASLAAASRSIIHAFAYELSSAAESLAHTNTVLYAQQVSSERFVTAFAVIIDPATGKIDYATAGHPPSLIRRSDGSIELLDVSNLPIGLYNKQVYDSAYNQLNPGDKLLLYTDGILEARHNLELFEIDGIKRTLIKHGHKSPAELTNELLLAAQSWADGQLSDDAAIVVIERNL